MSICLKKRNGREQRASSRVQRTRLTIGNFWQSDFNEAAGSGNVINNERVTARNIAQACVIRLSFIRYKFFMLPYLLFLCPLLQKQFVPELAVMIDLVVILDGIDVDEIEAFA